MSDGDVGVGGTRGEGGGGSAGPERAPEARERRPGPDEHARFYDGYLERVPDGDIVATLESQLGRFRALLESVPADRETFAYADGKWTVREVVGHVVDCERMLAYRVLHVARRDPAPLPDMDQEVWADGSNAASRSLRSLALELEAVRAATVELLEGLDDAAWDRRGVASSWEVSVRALAWIAAGHAEHHLRILVERYGLGAP
ncbi:MAG: DinB family protein [Gemmatimonadota bacterium]|jgi:hypothetical protein